MKYVCIFFIFLFITVGNTYAEAAGQNEIENALFSKLSVEEVNRFIDGVNKELHLDMPSLNLETLKALSSNGIHLDWNKLKNTIINTLVYETVNNAHLMGRLLFLAVLCAMLQNLQSSFEKSSIAILAYNLCYIFMAVIALNSFYQAICIVKDTVGYMVTFMEALLPLLISLLAGMGAITTAALLSPLMLFVVSSTSVIMKSAVLPLFILNSVLDCTNSFTDKYKVSNLSALLKHTGIIIMGFTMVLFIGIITIQGIAGSVADGLALRTAKFATATFIPVVGKIFADTVELVMGASLLMKNAVGLFGLLAISTICLFPIIKLLSLIVIIKLSGALIQPMGDEKMAKFLDAISNNLLLLFGVVLIVALMFFLSITMIVASGSAAMMLK